MDISRYVEIGKRLKTVRLELNKTQKQIAIESGSCRTKNSKYENGKLIPSLKLLLFLRERYNVNPGFILTGDGVPFITEREQCIASFIQTKPELKEILHQMSTDLGRFYSFMLLYYKAKGSV